jgi:hypothetical protein
MEFPENYFQKFQNSGKGLYMLMEANIMYLDQIDVIMCDEIAGKN